MTPENQDGFPDENLRRPFSEPITVKLGQPVVVNSEFILQAFQDPRTDYPSVKLAIFAKAQIPIRREDAIFKDPKKITLKEEGEVTMLVISISYKQPKVIYVGQTKLLLLKRDSKSFGFQIESPEALKLYKLDHNLNPESKSEARRILDPNIGFPANEDDIEARAEFEINRALEKYRMAQATQVEEDFLRRKGII